MPLEQNEKAPSLQFARLKEFLDAENAIKTTAGFRLIGFAGEIISKETKFGSISILDESNGPEGRVIKVQVQSPEPRDDWTTFMVNEGGIISATAEEENEQGEITGPQGSKYKLVEPKFTLDEVLAEL